MLRSKEFANQLRILDDRSPIGEFENQNHVFRWLMTLLTDEKCTTPSTEQFPIITKKIRDEVFGETKQLFYRRSPVYMSMKVILQHSLTMQMGAEKGKFVYKIVMLKFLIGTLAIYKNRRTFDTDLLSQMIAKLARRIEKLSEMRSITEDIVDFYEESVQEAKDTIEVIRAKIDRQIQHIQKDDEKRAQLRPLIDLDFEADIRYNIPTLEEYLCERRESSQMVYNPRFVDLCFKPKNKSFLPKNKSIKISFSSQINDHTTKNLH